MDNVGIIGIDISRRRFQVHGLCRTGAGASPEALAHDLRFPLGAPAPLWLALGGYVGAPAAGRHGDPRRAPVWKKPARLFVQVPRLAMMDDRRVSAATALRDPSSIHHAGTRSHQGLPHRTRRFG